LDWNTGLSGAADLGLELVSARRKQQAFSLVAKGNLMVEHCQRVRALLRGRSCFNILLLHLSSLQSTWIRKLVASLQMNDEQQSWEELQKRLDDPFKMYGAILGQTSVTLDIPRQGAAQMFKANWDGCRDLWKESYRAMKELRSLRSNLNG
jgi:hypothetical protein